MKGIILAGGTGSRLYPCTKVTNKHLLPVFDRPMIHYPIQTLKESGIRDILIISSSEHAGDFMQLLGSGMEFDVKLTYKIQDGAGGIAQALSLAEDFAAGESVAVILSDNIFEKNFSDEAFYFHRGAQIFVKKVEDPTRFGIVEMREDGTVRSVEEKPAFPKSNFAQTGFFFYDNNVFDFIRQLRPSKRGELEITDLNKIYLQRMELKAAEISGMWVDAGTHESLLEAALLAQEAFNPEGLKLRRSQKILRGDKGTELSFSPRVTIGLLTYNSEKYIEPCLNSILSQDYENVEIIIFDNCSVDDTVEKISANFPQIQVIQSSENLGFGKGHNEILRSTECEFYACLNVDMIFEQNFISELVKVLADRPVYGSVGGKLKRWDYENYLENAGIVQDMGKTNFIDSIGIRLLKSHRFEDIGHAEVDYGQYDQVRDIFGVSGAAVLYRRKALEDVSFINEDGVKEFFDETMFMYKEDVDLAYRLQWAGWKSRYTPLAIAFHDRSVRMIGRNPMEVIKNRLKKDRRVNQFSYLNHHILLKKNFSSNFSLEIKSLTFWYNFKVFIYIMLFETETLGQWWKLIGMWKKLAARKNSLQRRVSNVEIEKMMES